MDCTAYRVIDTGPDLRGTQGTPHWTPTNHYSSSLNTVYSAHLTVVCVAQNKECFSKIFLFIKLVFNKINSEFLDLINFFLVRRLADIIMTQAQSSKSGCMGLGSGRTLRKVSSRIRAQNSRGGRASKKFLCASTNCAKKKKKKIGKAKIGKKFKKAQA